MEDRFKFRFWDKDLKDYMRAVNLDKVFDDKSVIAEQCTGLKDMEENLVYEGDIVYSYDNDEAGIIEFDVARFVISFPKSKTWDDLYGSFTVIGNIHENPELLKELINETDKRADRTN